MPDRIHAKRLIRVPRARLLALATLVSGILVVGCGGSSHSPSAATSSTAAGAAATSSGSPPSQAHAQQGELAFANCMRANGVPNFPDPSPGGGASFPVPVGSSPAAPAFRAAQAKCQKLMPLPAGPGSIVHPSAQTLAKLLKIARCMRQHGVPQFPDPQTSVPSNPAGVREVTDFDGAILVFPATIDMQAPVYRQALTACGAPPLGLPH